MTQLSAAAVMFVDNVDRISAFYRGVAAMTVVHADDEHVVLEAAGFQLIVHAIRYSDAGETTTYPLREDGCIKLCLPVSDIDTARSVAVGLGGELWPPEREWQARGVRVCDGRDPEGNVFQLRQSVS
ncbi:VOC family protein [Lysobacter sp. Root604]|uniref:VOC family protein n=1 Tax=Lysobacter sp. Root604 TaxID=1736568 RepID=UPI0007145947|nr:VOC family protein [Lysobacter sp. Root604]KRA16377.1 hypothetical protein ASD69_16840 [Lysobacter sp. Root604]